MTYDKEKIDDFFEAQRGYFIKKMEMDDEGRPLYEAPDIVQGEIGISVSHDSRGGGWVPYEK